MTQMLVLDESSRLASDVKTTKSTKYPQYLAALIATLSAFCMGICLSWTSPALPMLLSPDSKIKINLEQGSWIGSLLTVGAFFGAIPAGALCSHIGPKRALQIIAFPMFLSWLIMAYCATVYGLYLARIIAGISIGAVCVAAPTYVAEIAETRIRGTLGTFFQLQVTIGLLFGYALGGSVDDFILLALIPAVIPVVYLISLSFMPESPVHLSAKGDVLRARISLQWFRGQGYDVDGEIERIRENIRAASSDRIKVGDLIACKATTRAMTISLGLMAFQQLSGVNAILFYSESIFADSGSTISPTTGSLIIAFVQVIATYISTLLIDRTGRRILLLISSSVMSICLTALGLYFHLKPICDVSSFAFTPPVCLAIFVVVFSIGFGPIPWIMLGELFNSKVKGIAMSISAAFNWMLAFLVTKFFHNLVDVLGTGPTFVMFGCICAAGFFFVLLMLPETKGKDISEIMIMLRGGKKDEADDESDQGINFKV